MQTFSVFIRQLRLESDNVVSVELEPVPGVQLPPATPGAHVDVQVPGAGVRSYSLIETPSSAARWRIAVKHEAQGRGGSRWFHDTARVGTALQVALPANDFQLAEDATHSIFIAGGIGITPLLAMIGRLAALGRSWELHYAAASRNSMPFQDALAARAGGRVVKHFSEDGLGRLDIAALIGGATPDTHFYCCGPSGMIDSFLAASQSRMPATVHYERFAARQEAATDGGFVLQLARDGRCLPVPGGKSILDVLLDAGLDVPYSCTQGVCGTCRIAVLDGEPEHRDDFLTDEEKAANSALMACCSGARSARLTLDL
ncbi:MAG: 2Fe-2S iron-sulfur cluster-binding protein [Ramlibacter sp.]